LRSSESTTARTWIFPNTSRGNGSTWRTALELCLRLFRYRVNLELIDCRMELPIENCTASHCSQRSQSGGQWAIEVSAARAR
jgi:hypothetical protein